MDLQDDLVVTLQGDAMTENHIIETGNGLALHMAAVGEVTIMIDSDIAPYHLKVGAILEDINPQFWLFSLIMSWIVYESLKKKKNSDMFLN